jgi:hypothetical protein
VGACKNCCAGLFALSLLALEKEKDEGEGAGEMEEVAEGEAEGEVAKVVRLCEFHEERARKEKEKVSGKRKHAKERRTEVRKLNKELMAERENALVLES